MPEPASYDVHELGGTLPMIGQVLGHYRITDKIGSGGMGEVYRARDERLKRDVAIKILSPQADISAETRHQLLREAQSASALNDPHICTIHEVGEADGKDFIVMEFVEGHPLSAFFAPRPGSSLLAQENHRVNRQRSTRRNPRGDEPERRHR